MHTIVAGREQHKASIMTWDYESKLAEQFELTAEGYWVRGLAFRSAQPTASWRSRMLNWSFSARSGSARLRGWSMRKQTIALSLRSSSILAESVSIRAG